MHLVLHTDGGSRGNPGPAAAGIVVADGETGEPVREAGYTLGRITNNAAEYQALIRGLENCLALGVSHLEIYSDSELMVKQITGAYRVKSQDLKPYYEQAQLLLLKVDRWHIQHVRREGNKRADELANMAMDAGRDVFPTGFGDSSVTAAESKPSKHASRSGGLQLAVRLMKKPGSKCPANCAANTPYVFGPSTPQGFCVYASQAVFDMQPTLWPDAKTNDGQTACERCGVAIHVERQ